MPVNQPIRRRLNLLAMTGACLLPAACGQGSSGTGTPIAVVTATPTPTPAPTPTPTPTPAPTPSGVTATTGVIVQAGDSIGVGLGADDYAAIDHLGLASGIEVHNASVNGQSMLTSYGRRAIDLFPLYDPSRTCVLLIEDGTNDLGGGTSATYLYNNIVTPFVAAAHAAGFYVAVDTILPRADTGWSPAYEQQRLAYNVMVRANAAGAEAVNDIAADPMIGDGGASPASSPFYADGLHPTVQGQQRLVALDATVLGLLLQYPSRARY